MKTKRLLAALLTFVMLVGILPSTALARARTDEYAETPLGESADEPLWVDDASETPAAADLTEVDLATLTDIASEGTVSTSTVWSPIGYTTEDHPEYLTDGDTSTEFKWVGGGIQTYINNGNGRPWINLHFDTARSIGGFQITVEHKDPDGDNVTYHYNVLGKTSGASDYQTLFSGTATKLTNGYIQTHTLPSLQLFTDIKLEFTEESTDAWPVLSEFDIFGEEAIDLSSLENIASDATITHSGTGSCDMSTWTDGNDDTESGFYGNVLPSTGDDAYVQLDLGENRQVGGFRLAAKADNETHWYTCDVYTKGDASTDWTLRAAGAEIHRIADQNSLVFALSALTDIRYVKFVLHQGGGGSWGALAELSVYAKTPSTPDPTPGEDGLIEVAALSTVSVPNNPDNAGKIIDGNKSTCWVSSDGNYPSNIDFALPGNLTIQRVEIDFEKPDADNQNRTFDLSLSVALNNILDTFSNVTSKTGHLAKDTYSYTLPTPQQATHLRVSLTGTNASAWPALAEVRIYAIDEKVDLDTFHDITTQSTETAETGAKEWDFGGNQQIAGFRATLPEGVTAVLKGRTKHASGWTTYFTELQSGDNAFAFPQGMSKVRVELDDPSQLTSFQIFGTYTAPVVDNGSIAFDKVPHTNYGSATSFMLTDGNTEQSWTAEMYPVYIDIDLEENYDVTKIEVYAPDNAQTEYTLYTSMDGNNFKFLDEAHTMGMHVHDSTTIQGFTSVEARVIRVYVEYYNQSDKPSLSEIRVMGTPTNTPVQTAPAINITPYDQTTYATPITEADTIAEVKGIIERQVGAKYVSWFDFAIAPQSNGYDYFTLENAGGKIKVTGNNGVSLATGVNHYLKYFCNVHISQVGNQTGSMPDSVVVLDAPVHKETKYPVRYAYNYCTHSYSMSFWGEPEWRNELDWLALNGVNVILDITGQEAVWREFLMNIGYTHEEAKDFLAGPGYYAWAYMANLTGFGGPVNDDFIVDRTELARKNQHIMRVLGMEPVLQAFSGMMPVDITLHDPDAVIIPQPGWNNFVRPTMLKTDTATYDKYAALFYAAQKEILGDVKYYATDPFHEGGDSGSLSPTTVSSELLNSLLEFDPDAVWVIQCWQENPSNALLAGLNGRRDHALVLDLYAERTEAWKGHNGKYEYPPVVEFDNTPWVWCMLNNFGGRMGLHGYLDSMQQNIPVAANTAQHMKGVGISPEGSQENPVLYDFLFETVWTDDADQPLPTIDLDQWLKDYVLRRYGAKSENAEQAMAILKDTVYNGDLKNHSSVGQGAPESVINARPAQGIGAASTWGYSNIYYDKLELEKAAKLLLADYDKLKDSDAYLYDLADVLKQVLSNTAQDMHSDMVAAYRSGDTDEFTAQSDRFLALIDTMEQLLSTRKEFLFGRWTTPALNMATPEDDFSQRLYLRNAKALVTTWGSIQQCNGGGLKDYSNRQWAGLTEDFYKARWIAWIDQAKENLAAGKTNNFDNSFDWFAFEWAYARNNEYTYENQQPDTTAGLLQTLGEKVLKDYSLYDPAADAENDLPLAGITVKAGSAEASSEQAPAANVLDNDTSTFWHTQYSAPVDADKKWIAFDLGTEQVIDGLRYLPRQHDQGRITQYKLFVSSDQSAWDSDAGWTEVTTTDGGVWSNNMRWKKASFPITQARYVKLLAIDNSQSSTDKGNTYYTAAEIRITTPSTIPVTGIELDQTALTLYTNEGNSHTATLTATVTPEFASNKAINWSSSDNSVVSVEKGVVTAVGNGSAIVTVSSQSDPDVTAECTVTVKTKITGQIAIDISPAGDPVFGSTLTANPGNILEAAREGLTYAWYRGDTATDDPIATGSSYSLTAADIGSKITLQATANGDFEGVSATATDKTVGLARGEDMQTDPTPVPCSDENTADGQITGLNAQRRYQYRKQNADNTWPDAWEDVREGTTSISGLATGNYQVRRWFDPATHTPGSHANVRVGVASIPEYAVNRPNADEHGNRVTALPRPAQAGEAVTITVTTTAGWELKSLTVTNDSDHSVITHAPVEGTDDEFSFTMPASAVTLTPVFGRKSYAIDWQLTNADVAGDKPDTAEHGVPLTVILAPESEYYQLPDRIEVTDAAGNQVAHSYDTDPADASRKVVGFANGITGPITVKVDAVKKTYRIGHDLTNVECNLGDEAAHKVEHKAAFTILLQPAEGYYLPTKVTITMGGVTLAEGTDYFYYPARHSIAFAEGVITGDLMVTAVGDSISSLDKSALQAAVDAAPKTQGNYTDASWAAFTEALEQAKEVLADPDADPTAVAEALSALETAQKGLTKKPSGGGSSSGSSSTPSTSTTTETREDGATVTTVTKPDGTVTETVKQPDGTKTEAVTTKDGDKTITVTDPEGEELVKIEIPAVIPEVEEKFEDLDSVPWAEEAVNNVAALELVKGTGGNKYDPIAPMTRGSLATVLHRLSQGKTDYEVTFKDVADGRYYTEGVAWAAKVNVVTGYTAEIFAPDDIITREQLAVMLARYAKLLGMDTTADAKSLDQFVDADATGDWAIDGVAWCVEQGLLKGKGQNNLDPTAEISRAEVAVLLDRFIVLIK